MKYQITIREEAWGREGHSEKTIDQFVVDVNSYEEAVAEANLRANRDMAMDREIVSICVIGTLNEVQKRMLSDQITMIYEG